MFKKEFPRPSDSPIGREFRDFPVEQGQSGRVGQEIALTRFAVEAWYPGDIEAITPEEVAHAIELAERAVKWARVQMHELSGPRLDTRAFTRRTYSLLRRAPRSLGNRQRGLWGSIDYI